MGKSFNRSAQNQQYNLIFLIKVNWIFHIACNTTAGERRRTHTTTLIETTTALNAAHTWWCGVMSGSSTTLMDQGMCPSSWWGRKFMFVYFFLICSLMIWECHRIAGPCHGDCQPQVACGSPSWWGMLMLVGDEGIDGGNRSWELYI